VAEIEGAIPPELATALDDGPTPARPAWMDEPTGLDSEGVYRAVATVGPFATREECDRALGPGVQQLVDDYVARYLEVSLGDAGADHRPAPRLMDLGAGAGLRTWLEPVESTVGPMLQLHAQVAFDRSAQATIAALHREAVVRHRLAFGGSLGALALAAVAAVLGYLKLDTLTRGYYSGRLATAAGLVVLAALASGAWLVARM
jgi:hypothetical protein